MYILYTARSSTMFPYPKRNFTATEILAYILLIYTLKPFTL